MFDGLRERGFDLAVRNHAEAILSVDFPDQTAELVDALAEFSISASEIIASGGGEATSTQRLRRRLHEAGWKKHNFVLETKIDGMTKESISHEIDHVRRSEQGTIALEIEWNNKDPFFDRDLENFQRLHAQSVVSVGVIVTRGSALQSQLPGIVSGFLIRNAIFSEQGLIPHGMKERTTRQRDAVALAMARGASFADAFTKFFVADKYGQATTHWQKLADRVARGVGNPCPLLLIGLPASVVRD
jgi:hypothetical protein